MVEAIRAIFVGVISALWDALKWVFEAFWRGISSTFRGFLTWISSINAIVASVVSGVVVVVQFAFQIIWGEAMLLLSKFNQSLEAYITAVDSRTGAINPVGGIFAIANTLFPIRELAYTASATIGLLIVCIIAKVAIKVYKLLPFT